MGQLYSKLNQLVKNDFDTASDPERPRQKLETTFTTPARLLRLPDPRSATQFISRTPILAAVATSSSGETPKAPKSIARPRYLETDLDDVLPDSVDESENQVVDLVPAMTTSTPVRHAYRNVIQPVVAAQEIVDSVIDKAIEHVSGLLFSDTGVCEVASSEFSSSGQTLSASNAAFMMLSSDEVKANESREPSYAEEVIPPEEDHMISCIDDVVEVVLDETNVSLVVNQSVLEDLDGGMPTRHFLADYSQSDISALNDSTHTQDYTQQSDCSFTESYAQQSDFSLAPEDSQSFLNVQSDSMIVHNDSTSFAEQSSDIALKWNSSESLSISSPPPTYTTAVDTEKINKKNLLVTPQKAALKSTTGVRTPLGDVSTNSPIISQQNSTPKQKTLLQMDNDKIWKNIRDERLKLVRDSENTPPHCVFNSYPPEVVHSAPGKIRTNSNKNSGTKWSNDSLLI